MKEWRANWLTASRTCARAPGSRLPTASLLIMRVPDDVARVMTVHGDYIKEETLSNDLLTSVPEDAAKSETAKVEGMEVTLGVRLALPG